LHADYSVTFPDSSDSPETPHSVHSLNSKHTVYSDHSDFVLNLNLPTPLCYCVVFEYGN